MEHFLNASRLKRLKQEEGRVGGYSRRARTKRLEEMLKEDQDRFINELNGLRVSFPEKNQGGNSNTGMKFLKIKSFIIASLQGTQGGDSSWTPQKVQPSWVFLLSY